MPSAVAPTALPTATAQINKNAAANVIMPVVPTNMLQRVVGLQTGTVAAPPQIIPPASGTECTANLFQPNISQETAAMSSCYLPVSNLVQDALVYGEHNNTNAAQLSNAYLNY